MHSLWKQNHLFRTRKWIYLSYSSQISLGFFQYLWGGNMIGGVKVTHLRTVLFETLIGSALLNEYVISCKDCWRLCFTSQKSLWSPLLSVNLDCLLSMVPFWSAHFPRYIFTFITWLVCYDYASEILCTRYWEPVQYIGSLDFVENGVYRNAIKLQKNESGKKQKTVAKTQSENNCRLKYFSGLTPFCIPTVAIYELYFLKPSLVQLY
jgi:hypothetical protein